MKRKVAWDASSAQQGGKKTQKKVAPKPPDREELKPGNYCGGKKKRDQLLYRRAKTGVTSPALKSRVENSHINLKHQERHKKERILKTKLICRGRP